MRVRVFSHSGGLLYDGEAREVLLPTLTGQVGILEGHADLYTVLSPGKVNIKGGKEMEIEVKKGYGIVNRGEVKIFIFEG